MEQSICIFYANVPIFAPLHLSPLIIANPIQYLLVPTLSKATDCLALHYNHNSNRKRARLFYSLSRIPSIPQLPIVWEDSTDHKTVKHNDID